MTDRLTPEQRAAILADDAMIYYGVFSRVFAGDAPGVDVDEETVMRALRSLAIIDGLSEEQREHLRKCPSLMDMPCNRFANPDAFHCIEAHRAVVALMEDR